MHCAWGSGGGGGGSLSCGGPSVAAVAFRLKSSASDVCLLPWRRDGGAGGTCALASWRGLCCSGEVLASVSVALLGTAASTGGLALSWTGSASLSSSSLRAASL